MDRDTQAFNMLRPIVVRSETLGKGWEDRENGARHRFAKVRYCDDRYEATVFIAGRQFMAYGTDPRAALGHAVHDARTYIERMTQELDSLLD